MNSRLSYLALFPHIRVYRRSLTFALICTVVYVLSMPMIAVLIGQAAQYVGDQNLEALLYLPGVVGLFFVIRGGFEYGQDVLMAQVAFDITLNLRRRVYTQLQQQELPYFQQAATGDLVYRMTEDIDRIGEILNQLFHQSVPCALQLVAVLAYMIYLNWTLTVAALVLAPLVGWVIGWFGERLLAFARRSQTQVASLASLLTETLRGMAVVKAYGAEDYEMERFMQVARQSRQATFAVERIKAIQYPIVGIIEAIAVSLLFLLGGWQISLGQLTPSQFISFVAAAVLLIDPINLITENYNKFKQGQASIDRIQALLELPRHPEPQNAKPLPYIKGAVEFRHVSFAYHPQQPVLKNLSFQVQPGETIALIGPSGAGKSTLAHLLLRLYQPTAGQILVDGIDLQSVSRQSWYQQIGIVPQHTYLFSGTISQNIAYGQADFELSQVQKAADIANASEFIQQLPQGFHTYLGEQGTTLSGGQRQRIAIARAVFRNPRILVLDEATSALDTESEALVQAALENLMGGPASGQCTVILIAHRLTTVLNSDRIFVVENGQIVESGTHQQLMANGLSRYASLYAKQLK
ncbi:ABC transporter ATP-binding protein [Acaryochloris sp. CCMEE 5410]|uniref:ABC transporter ATP-binding protein n=1 Tax=Acaryochloris sp. CCMEE 5410 TaxID=310037 RepID=UPI000493F3F5|nr:ABC transporter ATP-binding protein [Acaryochloris sp. CCMEE 5410]KAI9131460.1 ABC transporter ATP-binding protein [Acaryochloris sp. CCMEE 5410]